MNDLNVTVTGWVATDPKQHTGTSGEIQTTFRLASTSRYYDRAQGRWIDRDTEWFTVRTFRRAAQHIAESIAKGQPVIVVGRLHSNEWHTDSGQRTDLVIDAATIGHDLTRGTATFLRAISDPDEAPITAADIPDVPADTH
ncbi:single-stranded DNA-binding protein [Demequina sp.]|uniref:single-stranded DNA-binding protein n=1 Tax=Demequina sp. TaxID=2050685 RepID=UPI003D0E9847